MRKQTHILGVPFDAVTMDEAVLAVQKMVKNGGQHIVCTPNPEIVMEARNDKALMDVIIQSSLVVPDGVGVVWASRYSEIPMTQRVAGYDLTQELFSAMADTDTTFYFFGGAPGVASEAARKMKKKYPGLKILGIHNGFFDDVEEKKVIAHIKSLSPTILLVGLGAPKQEKWIQKHLEETGVTVAIGVGGSFDVMAGVVKRAPKVFQRLGLEWFYRLITQPTRWRRMMRLPLFALEVLKNRERR